MLCGEGGKTLAQVSQRDGKCFIQMLLQVEKDEVQLDEAWSCSTVPPV